MPGVDTHPAIFVVLTIDKVGFIAFRDQVVILDFVGAHTVILNADDVGILPGQPFKETLLNRLCQAVDAYCYDTHTCSLILFVCIILFSRFN